MVTEPDCYTFCIEDCDMDPVGPVRKENMDIIRLVYDFSCYLGDETIAQIVFTTVAPISTAQNYRGWQADYPIGNVASSALPADLYPLLVSRTAITGDGKTVDIWLTAGTPDLMYLMSFAVLTNVSLRRKQVDTLVSIDTPLNPALLDPGVIPDDIYVKKAGDNMTGPLEIDVGGTALKVLNGTVQADTVQVVGVESVAFSVLNGGSTLASLHVNGGITAVGDILSTGGILDAATIACNTLRVDVAETTANLSVGGNATIGGSLAVTGLFSTGVAGASLYSLQVGNVNSNGSWTTSGGINIAGGGIFGGDVVINGSGTALSVPGGTVNLPSSGLCLSVNNGSAFIHSLTVDTLINNGASGGSGPINASSLTVGPLTIDSSGNVTTSGNFTSSGTNGFVDAAQVACNTLRVDVSANVSALTVHNGFTTDGITDTGPCYVNHLVVNSNNGGAAIFAPAGNIQTLGALIGDSLQVAHTAQMGSATVGAGLTVNGTGTAIYASNGDIATVGYSYCAAVQAQRADLSSNFAGGVTINGGGTSLYVSAGNVVCTGFVDAAAYRAVRSDLTSVFSGAMYITGNDTGSFAGDGLYVSYGIQTAANLVLGGEGYKPGGGYWAASSDKRIKRDVVAYPRSLAEVLQINPITYSYNGLGGTIDDGRTHVGLIADDVQPIMPEMVGTQMAKLNPDDAEETAILTLNATGLLYALVNACKELSAKNDALEARIAALEAP